MKLLELMKKRHSVRLYEDRPIEEEKKVILNELIKSLNVKYGTNVQIFYDDADGFKNAKASYGNFSGCTNYIALVAKDAEIAGYVGEIIVLKAQELGLNTCFVALTYKRGAVKGKVNKAKGEKVQCNIALGYGKNQGVSHKIKSSQDVLELYGEKPEYLDTIVEACLLAPTAMNQQKFKVVCENDNIYIKKSGLGFYLDFDLGIVKCHKDLILEELNKKNNT
ncbi:MAG: nitroreductase [Clostridia bacterium]|nr:nitroreductase [Clostridia bacterium]